MNGIVQDLTNLVTEGVLMALAVALGVGVLWAVYAAFCVLCGGMEWVGSLFRRKKK